MCTGCAQAVGPSALGVLLLISHSSQAPLITQCCGLSGSKTRLLILNSRGTDPAGSRVKFHVNVVSGVHIGGNWQRVSGIGGVSCGNHHSRFTTSKRITTFPMLSPGGNPGGFTFPGLTFWLVASFRYSLSPSLNCPKSMMTS